VDLANAGTLIIFLAVAKELDSKGIEVIFLLGPAEVDRFNDATIKKISRFARCLRDLSLAQVLGLLSCSSGFIGNDSGITHLAAGLGVRTLAVFGPTNPVVYIPIGSAVKVFANNTTAFTKKPLVSLQHELLDVFWRKECPRASFRTDGTNYYRRNFFPTEIDFEQLTPLEILNEY